MKLLVPTALIAAIVLCISIRINAQPDAAPNRLAAAPASQPAVPPGLESTLQKVCYAIAFQIGSELSGNGLKVDATAFMKGLTDGQDGNKPVLTNEQIGAAMKELQEQLSKVKDEEAKANKAAGEKFLADNKTKAGVKTTVSGLQYKVIKEGEGASPKATDTVKVHYRGTLINGKPFDSSYDRGEPSEFACNRVIPGWTEGLQLMKIGAKYEFFIPAELAYGEDPQQGGKIPVNSVLLFEVELLEIKAAPKTEK